jgi:hypothetical protein
VSLTTETSLRVRFAKALGYEFTDDGYPFRRNKAGQPQYLIEGKEGIPPIDANTIHEALMGMTEEEWECFTKKLSSKLDLLRNKQPSWVQLIIKCTLKTEPTTLAEIYCEVKGVHEK